MFSPLDEKVMVVLDTPYNGPMRGYEFVEGRSVGPVPIMQALRIGGVMTAHTDKGEQLSPNTWFLERQIGEVQGEVVAPPEGAKTEVETEVAPAAPVTKWTRDELGRIADDRGIEGLREIAEYFHVKERSVIGLIDKILEVQGPAEAPVAE